MNYILTIFRLVALATFAKKWSWYYDICVEIQRSFKSCPSHQISNYSGRLLNWPPNDLCSWKCHWITLLFWLFSIVQRTIPATIKKIWWFYINKNSIWIDHKIMCLFVNNIIVIWINYYSLLSSTKKKLMITVYFGYCGWLQK